MRPARLVSASLPLVFALSLAAPVFAADPQASPLATAEKKLLTDDEVKRYVATLDELVAAGVAAEKELGMATGGEPSMQQSLQYSEKIRAIVERHGFDREGFSNVHGNVMLAYAALEMAKHRDEIDEAKRQQEEQMAELKAQLPPEQYEAMVQGMAAMSSLTDAYQDVPEANKKLVEKYRAKLDAILSDADR